MITRKCSVSFGYFAITMLLLLAAAHVMNLFTVSEWLGVSVGSAIFIISGTLRLTLKKRHIILPIVILLNAVADGITLSSLFVHIKISYFIIESVLVFVGFMFLFHLYCLLAYTKFFQNHYKISLALFSVLIIAADIVCLVLLKNFAFYISLFCFIPFIGFLISLSKIAYDKGEQTKNVSNCSFAILLIIIIVVMIFLSEGEILDGADADPNMIGSGGWMKRNPYEYVNLELN